MSNIAGCPSNDKPWLKFYDKNQLDEELPVQSIYEYMYENNKDYLEDIALIYLKKKITYGQLIDNISIVEKALTALGVKKGDIVTVAMPCTPEAVYCVYALNKIRAVANMIHPLAGSNEIVDYLNEVQSTVFLMFTGTYTIIKDVLDKTNVKKAVVAYPTESLGRIVNTIFKVKSKKIKWSKQVISWSDFIKDGKSISELKIEDVNCHEISIMSHTGGTTGTPKCVMLTDYNINSAIWQIGATMKHDRQETMLVCLPPFVNYSLTNSILEPLAYGFKAVLVPEYHAEKFAEYVAEYKFNHLNAIPAYWEALLNIKGIEKCDLSNLVYCFYGGDAMNPVSEAKVNDILISGGAKHKLGKGYGATEMTSAVTATFDECNEPGSIGIPLPKMICQIVDSETNEELGYGEEGEICFTGPSIMVGYYQNEVATNEIIKVHSDGHRYIHMGDLGYITKDGVIFITGRIKRLMITKGRDGMITKIFPERIEKVIMQHPRIKLCCTIGIADEHRVNIPKSFIVLNEVGSDIDKIKSEITSLCNEELPEYMVPEEIEIIDVVPRTPRGKVDYRALEMRR